MKTACKTSDFRNNNEKLIGISSKTRASRKEKAQKINLGLRQPIHRQFGIIEKQLNNQMTSLYITHV